MDKKFINKNTSEYIEKRIKFLSNKYDFNYDDALTSMAQADLLPKNLSKNIGFINGKKTVEGKQCSANKKNGQRCTKDCLVNSNLCGTHKYYSTYTPKKKTIDQKAVNQLQKQIQLLQLQLKVQDQNQQENQEVPIETA